MKKELEYFIIDGAFGGNQEWFTNVVMNMGGCAAATACDCCIYLALRKGMEGLYPYPVHQLTKKDYITFSQKMKPYIRPRIGGVKKLRWFIEGFEKYIREECGGNIGQKNITINMKAFSGSRDYEEARKMVLSQIDAGYPVPYLLLRHKKPEIYKDYIWHWFLLVGYEDTGDNLLVKTATYGESDTFSFRELWDTGCEEKGGMVQLGTGYF
ncbi:hypothetical protein AALA78_06390 [Lachnospiraceae bacterium 42-17]